MGQSAAAAPVLDQVFGPPGAGVFQAGIGSAVDQDAAQTFTVGVAGELATTSLQLSYTTGPGLPAPPVAPLQVDIVRTVAGAPSLSPADVLGTVFVSQQAVLAAGPSHLVTMDFSPSHIAVTPGEVLAIVLRYYAGIAGPGDFVYIAEGTTSFYQSTYAGGESWIQSAPPHDDWKTTASVFLAPGGTADLFFATTVSVPEPSTVGLCTALGLLVATTARQRRRT